MCRRILVYGTGYKSVAAVTRLRNSPHYRVVGFLTCTADGNGAEILEYPVYGFENPAGCQWRRWQCDRRDIRCRAVLSSEGRLGAGRGRLLKYATEGDLRILITPRRESQTES